MIGWLSIRWKNGEKVFTVQVTPMSAYECFPWLCTVFFCRWIRCERTKKHTKQARGTYLANECHAFQMLHPSSLSHPIVHQHPPFISHRETHDHHPSPLSHPTLVEVIKQPGDLIQHMQNTGGSRPQGRHNWRRLARTQHLKFYESSAHFLTYFMENFPLGCWETNKKCHCC